GNQAIRLDMAERLFRAAHDARSTSRNRDFRIDPALATSIGLTPGNYVRLMRDAGFSRREPDSLAPGAFGPPAPARWRWRPPRREDRRRADRPVRTARPSGAFSALAELLGCCGSTVCCGSSVLPGAAAWPSNGCRKGISAAMACASQGVTSLLRRATY